MENRGMQLFLVDWKFSAVQILKLLKIIKNFSIVNYIVFIKFSILLQITFTMTRFPLNSNVV